MDVETLNFMTNVATLLTAMFGLTAAVVALVKTNRNVQAIHVSINSELAEFKRLIAAASHAEGVIQGEANQRRDNGTKS